MEHARRISQIASLGLVVIFAGLAGFAVSAASVTKASGNTASVAIAENRQFEAASAEMVEEETLTLQYRIAPSRALRARYEALKLRQDEHLRSARDVPGFQEIIRADVRYDKTVGRLFATLDAGRSDRVRVVQERQAELAFLALQTIVATRSTSTRARADAALRALTATEDVIARSTAVISAIGGTLLVLLLFVLRRYERLVSDALSADVNLFKHAARTDYLTGLGNHRAYQEDLTGGFAQRSKAGSIVTIALVDVDELKVLNDRNGHVVGDRLLSSLAQVLRSADLHSVPYRLGGDEFALAFVGMTSAVAKVRMEQVRGVVEAQLGGTTISIGISTTTSRQPDLLVVREQADAALYEAKRRGRNTVVLFDEIRDEHAMFLPARVEEVRRLIAASSIGVAFQPVWSIDNRSLIGYEALARPGGKDPISPQDAFDIAERIGKAHELDRVCRRSILAKAGALPAGAMLFLNVSPQSLDHAELTGSTLVNAVEAAGLTPARVVLEITERSVARLDVVVREATRLRSLGFRLALDDAGSGNAGLEMLSKLAVDYVKIDREVIVRAQAGAAGRGVLAGIIAIAREMHAQIVAEGIEDSAMLELVRRATRHSPMDCAVQGYYLGAPQSGFVETLDMMVAIPRLAGPAPHSSAKPVPT